MWCVASAPIVPLARDLDAAFGTQLSELAVHFRKLSTPLLTAPLPSRAHPRFFRKLSTPLLTAPLPSRAHPRFLHTPSTPLRLSAGSLRAFPHLRHVPPRSTPLPPRLHRSHGDLSSENTKKRAPFLRERCSFWVAKRSTFGRVVLTCATMGDHTGGKRVRRRGLACATCAVDLIDATLYFGIAAGESIFAHSAVAIDAAHHFAGGLFHTACGRLCGRGGRGRRRGGRARSRCGSVRCGSSLGRRSCGGSRCGSRGRRRSCGGVGLATGLGTRCFARRGGGGFGVSVGSGGSFAGAFARSRLSAGGRRCSRRAVDDDTVVLTGSRHTRRAIVATLAHEIHTSCGQQGHDHGSHPPFSTTRRGLWRSSGAFGRSSFHLGRGNFRSLFRAEGDFAFELDHGKGF